MGFFSNLFKKNNSTNELEVFSVYPGKIKELAKVNDLAFSSESMGKGFAVEFSNADTKVLLKAPISGKLEVMFPTKHAYVFESKNGLKVFIHIGIDTVKMQGDGFVEKVNIGDEVKKGDGFVEVDLAKIRANNFSSDVIVTILPESNASNIDSLFVSEEVATMEKPVLKVIK